MSGQYFGVILCACALGCFLFMPERWGARIMVGVCVVACVAVWLGLVR